MAAAVLEVGREEASPMAKTLGKPVCWRVEGETGTKPEASEMGEFWIGEKGEKERVRRERGGYEKVTKELVGP